MDPTTQIAALTLILQQNPTDPFARYALALAHTGAGNPDQALVEFSNLLAQSPDYVPAYQMSAQTLLKLHRTAEARDRLTSGLAAAHRTGNTHAASEMQAMLDDLDPA